ncbi:MAG: glycogen debranching protein GlgX [bacterium]
MEVRRDIVPSAEHPEADGLESVRSLLDVVGVDFEISRGTALPLGATLLGGGINFAVYSSNATSVWLVIYEPDADKPIAELPLDPRFNRTGDIWHTHIRGMPSSIEYGYRVARNDDRERHIHRFDSTKVLVDPYARALSGRETWGRAHVDRSGTERTWRSLVVEDHFDWEFDQPLNTPLSQTIIYELHVRGYTRHKSSGVRNRGTYDGLIEKIPYLKQLGITAVELLPVNEFSETDNDRTNPLTGQTLLNYWGYHSIGFFAPKAAYSSRVEPGAPVVEFKRLVRAFHKAGIEIILDVVFNHTAEGNELGPTVSFRGLDNSVYYLIDPDSGAYHNYTGCGNTLNCNHPVVRDMILECLRYWVMEMHVDGFRFDLASVLGRGRDGSVLANPPLLERIAADPVLRHTKLIAEAWDAAGLYQVGTFPSWGRWVEWNARFRDDVRCFVRGDPGMVPALANRLLGSPDMYSHRGQAHHHHVNFVTCHDGFTLRDLVSYNAKHNEANGEAGRDGCNCNCSWNCGYEGATGLCEVITAPSAADIERLRQRQGRNFAALLLLSRGVPMILAGDEFGRTQKGNNNAYCQDNEVSWVDWRLAEENADLSRFFRLLMAFRKSHPVLAGGLTDPSESDPTAVVWHGVKPEEPDWSWESRSLAVQLTETSGDRRQEIYVVANAYWKSLRFVLPRLDSRRCWHRAVDTMLAGPDDISEPGREPVLDRQTAYLVGPHSVIVILGH